MIALQLPTFVRPSPLTRVNRAVADPATTCSRPGLAALTFDDGPYDYENEISDYLHARQIKGTFFVNGYNYGCIYDEANVQRLKRTFSQGHLIGSHSWSHPHIGSLSANQLNQQLDLVEGALMKILGVKPKFFRAPYGEHSQQNLELLAKRGYTVVDWSFDAEDAVGASPEDSIESYKQLAKNFPASQITLNHETYQTTAQKVTPNAVSALQNAGYKLVHVSECLGLGIETKDLYLSVGTPSARDSSWTCDGTPAPGA
ncbi:hypothetical protein PCASD_02201 [Puccinia coronata f. sp. avenae]|uniref:NodB homology domain-containing protein n=1 Tax=Puccinia coronata f. sp. avenae TaxID=200324 RepID=A0A2N5SZV9_9BASI|nr:hypothetical protein PCASD_20748 [Puccinia coronata f. sp. avenae]PLW49646.1 hypothetical protein PCASD_02201 [Puccinia coronata f. sp. avenae]